MFVWGVGGVGGVEGVGDGDGDFIGSCFGISGIFSIFCCTSGSGF